MDRSHRRRRLRPLLDPHTRRWAADDPRPPLRPAILTGSLDTLDHLHVCHVCDNPICVRAEDSPTSHLYAGTAFDNLADRVRRGHHNQQPAAAFFRHETKQQRAHAARVLRAHVRAHGYDPEAVATLLRGVTTGQQTLF